MNFCLCDCVHMHSTYWLFVLRFTFYRHVRRFFENASTSKRHHTIPGNEHNLLLVTGRDIRWMVVFGTGTDTDAVKLGNSELEASL